MNILDCRFVEWHKKATFYRFCLKAMIKRLLELEAAAVFTRNEVLDIVKTSEHQNEDSVLHLLASDAKYGFQTLKFILDLLFPGKLPEEKNKQGKTAFSIAWETDSENALKLFFSGPSEDLQQRATSSQGSSTTTQSVETSTPNDAKNQNQIVINIDIMTSDGNQSTEGSGDIATGYPIPKVVVTSFDPKAVSCEASSSLSTLPKIAKSCSENSHEETSDEEMSDEETLSTTSSDVEVVDVETCDVSVNRSGLRRQLTVGSDSDTDTSSSSSEIDVVEVETASGRKRKKGTGVDDPFWSSRTKGLALLWIPWARRLSLEFC
ncbi:hypothetical protein OS493_004263 [Desmophyllum pertusum]|uniref:Uncharacterized protein n=1 Tax=Desmophyllum pertusum TaxID=174260 RepID=A0A9W9ZSY9_9CNID|nr:hypothetical protein OS493_004263 [Desmophyllum pertusum]